MKTPAKIMLVSKIVRPRDRLKRGLKQAIKALLGAVARQNTRVPLMKHGILETGRFSFLSPESDSMDQIVL